MAVEIRAARPAEMEEFTRVATEALLISPEYVQTLSPEWTLCAFEDGKLATAYGAWPWTMRFNGEAISVAGVTLVGTLPVSRRRGHLHRVIAAHFQMLHEQGEQPIAILWASKAAIYQRYGYAVVSTRNLYDIEPRYLQFAAGAPASGAFREVGDDEFGMLVDLYRHFRAERIGYIHRPRGLWYNGVLAPPAGRRLLSKVVYEEAGEPLGYVIYTAEPHGGFAPGMEQRLAIRDLVWLSPASYRALWEYFARMDLANHILWERVPPDDPLPHLLLEPRMLHMSSHDGLLGRIIDVERALPARGYQDEARLTFEVLDDLCPWNRGRWRLETSTSGASIGGTGEKPELVMPVSTLAMLVFGQISATEAARMGRLDVLDTGSLPRWNRVLRTAYRPFCPDLF